VKSLYWRRTLVEGEELLKGGRMKTEKKMSLLSAGVLRRRSRRSEGLSIKNAQKKKTTSADVSGWEVFSNGVGWKECRGEKGEPLFSA